VGAADGLAPASDRPKCRTLPSADQVLDRARHVLDRHGGVDAVLVEQVDAVGPQALQRGLDDLADAFGPAVHAPRRPLSEDEAELGGDLTLSGPAASASPTSSSLV
jgi:hypothetical protein